MTCIHTHNFNNLLILRKRERDREKNVYLLFHLYMHLLVNAYVIYVSYLVILLFFIFEGLYYILVTF